MENHKSKKNAKEFDKIRLAQVRQFDQELKSFKIPIVLLERLKKEFDESHSLSNEMGKTVIY